MAAHSSILGKFHTQAPGWLQSIAVHGDGKSWTWLSTQMHTQSLSGTALKLLCVYGRQCFRAGGFWPLEEDNFWICFIFYYLFLLEYSHFTALCQFLPCSKVNHQYIHIHSLLFRFPSYLGHQRALSSSLCCAVGSVSYLLYTWKWKLLSHVWLFVTPWIMQSMEFSRPEFWGG